MLTEDPKCPHCKAEIDCTDGPHGQDETEVFECDCGHEIYITCNYTVEYDVKCADRDHDIITDAQGQFANEHYECSRCDHYFFKSIEDKRRAK